MFSWNGEVDALQFNSDIYFLQRWKERFTKDVRDKDYNYHYTNNYGKRGLCIIDKNNKLDVEVGQFNYHIKNLTDETQGQYWQTLKLGKYKIINSSICYPDPEEPILQKSEMINSFDSGRVPYKIYYEQGKELLSMIDDNTLILTDLHFEDSEIEQQKVLSLKERNIKNHLKDFGTFTNKNNYNASLDKILTTQNSNIKISNIDVIKCEKEESSYGHWPISFNIQFA